MNAFSLLHKETFENSSMFISLYEFKEHATVNIETKAGYFTVREYVDGCAIRVNLFDSKKSLKYDTRRKDLGNCSSWDIVQIFADDEEVWETFNRIFEGLHVLKGE